MIGSISRLIRRFGGAKAVITLSAAGIATAAWVGVLVATDLDQELQLRQAQARAANLALVFEEQVYRQVLAIDQTLRILKGDYERDPGNLDMLGLQRRAGTMSDLVSQVLLIDYRGRVIASTRRDMLDSDQSTRRFFTAHRSSDNFGPLITGPLQSNGQWYLNISRRINAAHNVFAGVITAGYDLNALMRDMSQADLGARGLMMLVGRDGMVRALMMRGAQEPGSNISASPMFAAMTADNGAMSWTGPSPVDGDVRIHAFRPVPGLDMTLVVGLDRSAALSTAELRRQQALLGATAVTLLVVLMAVVVAGAVRAASIREQRMTQDRAVLEAANLQLARARERADEKSLQLGMTLAGMSDGISMFSPELNLIEWNSQFAELTGLNGAALRVGTPMAEILRIQVGAGEFGPVADLAAEVESHLATIRNGEWLPVSTRVRPNGRVIELRRTQLPDGGFVTLYSDVTDRKLAEDAQNRAREVAEVAAQEKSRFVAIVSHEIRTPLNVALNALGLLDQSHLQDSQRRLVETGLMAGESLMGLLNDILDLSRMQVGRLQLRPTTFSLRSLLENVVEMFRHQALERGVELSFYVAPRVPDRLVTDVGRLRQMLMNLVSNTAKFAEPGEASIRVMHAMLNGERVLRLAVRDSGPMIPDLDRARLFRPFSQLERAGGTGTGLGLAICQLLANLLGGQIGCDASEEGGKEFWLTLPIDVLDAPVELPALTAPQAQPCWLPRSRLLLVEDVLANQMIVATMLRREGHMVDLASSGQEAIERVASGAYDMILMDIFMPGINGMEATRRIRALPAPMGTVPIVALTANVAAADRAEYLEAGMVDLVGKPIDRMALLAVMSRHIWQGRRVNVPTLVATPMRPLPAGSDLPALDPDRLAAWRDGLPDLVGEALLSDCLRQLREMTPELNAALQVMDRPSIQRVAHAMAGVSGNYGLAALEALVKAIYARDPAACDPAVVMEQIAHELDRAEQASMGLFRLAAE